MSLVQLDVIYGHLEEPRENLRATRAAIFPSRRGFFRNLAWKFPGRMFKARKNAIAGSKTERRRFLSSLAAPPCNISSIREQRGFSGAR